MDLEAISFQMSRIGWSFKFRIEKHFNFSGTRWHRCQSWLCLGQQGSSPSLRKPPKADEECNAIFG